MIKKILLFLWQLPQNILGYILSRNYEYISTARGINIYYKKNISFISFTLGRFTIMDYFYCGRSNGLHELQKKYLKVSKIIGWLYLPVIFIPQLIINIIGRFKYDNVFLLNDYLNTVYPSKFINKVK